MSEISISAERQDEFRRALRSLITSPDLSDRALSDPGQISNALFDLLPDAQLERNVLRSAIENGVAGQLSNLITEWTPVDTAIGLVAESLASSTGLSAQSSSWVCREIAIALRFVDPTEWSSPAPAPADARPVEVRPADMPTVSAPPASTTEETVVRPAFQEWRPVPAAMPTGRPRRPRAIAVVVAALVVVAAATGVLVWSRFAPKPAAKPSVSFYQVSSAPDAVALAGPAAWVAQSDRVEELNAGDGSRGIKITDGLSSPLAVAAGDGYVWVANANTGNGSLDQLSARTGRVINRLGPSEHIDNPVAVAIAGNKLWVASLGILRSGSITCCGWVSELNVATGKVIRTIQGKPGGITFPDSIAVSGPYLWVADSGSTTALGGVTRIDTRTGALLTKEGGGPAASHFERPSAVAIGGSHVWVLNNPFRGPRSLTELNASDGSFVHRWYGSRYDFGSYANYSYHGVAAAGDRVWVANQRGGSDGHGSVTEINARTGAIVRVMYGSKYHFYDPWAIVVAGSAVWIANAGGNGVPGSITVLRSFG